MKSETQRSSEAIEFPFELVIRRRGFFIMTKESYTLWSNSTGFDHKMRRQNLRARQVALPNYYINGSNVFYRIEYYYGD